MIRRQNSNGEEIVADDRSADTSSDHVNGARLETDNANNVVEDEVGPEDGPFDASGDVEELNVSSLELQQEEEQTVRANSRTVHRSNNNSNSSCRSNIFRSSSEPSNGYRSSINNHIGNVGVPINGFGSAMSHQAYLRSQAARTTASLSDIHHQQNYAQQHEQVLLSIVRNVNAGVGDRTDIGNRSVENGGAGGVRYSQEAAMSSSGFVMNTATTSFANLSAPGWVAVPANDNDQELLGNEIVGLDPTRLHQNPFGSRVTTSTVPCKRSLHSAAVVGDTMYVFGGYSGAERLNDFHSYSFKNKVWKQIHQTTTTGPWPSERDRHVSVVHGNAFYIFGGFDGTSRVNDLFKFSVDTMTWSKILPSSGAPPSPRHSHAAVVHGDKMWVYGGYDGSYRCDFHCFDFITNTWSLVPAVGRPPRARYRATCVVYKNNLICFGGHDGTQHLSDTHVFDFEGRTWQRLETIGQPPIPRDSHVSVVVNSSMWVFAGSSGSALNDLNQLNLESHPARWSPAMRKNSPDRRFCHVAVSYEQTIYVFGGYNGNDRLNDFVCIDLSLEDLTCAVPKSSLVSDLRTFINNEQFSDVTLVIEGHHVSCHKIMLMRSPYFQAMLLGEMMESTSTVITLHEIRHSVFMIILEYLYTDDVYISVDMALDVLAAADQFCICRLKAMCENKLLESICCENAAFILLQADQHDASVLKSKALKYIVAHFETISKTEGFEEMARTNVELVFEILRNR